MQTNRSHKGQRRQERKNRATCRAHMKDFPGQTPGEILEELRRTMSPLDAEQALADSRNDTIMPMQNDRASSRTNRRAAARRRRHLWSRSSAWRDFVNADPTATERSHDQEGS